MISRIISHISKRIFLADGDIVDIMINLHGYIEDISAKDVVVEGLSQYAYEVQPRPNISDMKGLFIIEFILFESEKFLRENTRRSQKEWKNLITRLKLKNKNLFILFS